MNLTDPKQAKEYFAAKMAFTTGPVELNRMIQAKENITIIDLRYPDDYAKGHIPGAINLPKNHWEAGSGLQKDKINVL